MADVIVHGVELRENTRCAHYHSEKDIIAIKMKCCGRFYACIKCHEALETHEPQQWKISERNEKAILCGACKKLLTIEEYLCSNNQCIYCHSSFNPGCRNHYHYYFE